MIPVKVQCGCGQRYSFEVEPVNGRMPTPVACPVCGADGTSAANELISRGMIAEPVAAPAPAPAAGLRIQQTASPPVAPSPPPPPVSSAPKASVGGSAYRKPKRKKARGKDGWATEETSLNKLGTYIVVGPGALGALVLAGFMGIEIPPMILCAVIGGCGLVGGMLNLFGRGPVLAGAVIGVIIALGGFGAAYWWVNGRESVYTIEATIAFVVGAIPGFVLQAVLQQLLQKRAGVGG